MPKAIVITVGTGRKREDIAHAISFSIDKQNPDYIVFITTVKSNKETIPYIINDENIKNKKYKIETLSTENDIEQIQEETENYIKEVIKKGYSSENIIVDFTSGTKAMSAALILSSIKLKIKTLSYIEGQRDETGRVITGIEKISILEPNRIYAKSLFDIAVKQFNKYQFEDCLDTLNQIKILISEEQFQKKILLLENLAKAYSFWDKFEIKQALTELDKISKSNDLIKEWGIKNKIEKHKEILYKEKENNFCEEKAIDLLENAIRRGYIEKKYDDAVARLYRLIEFLAQNKLAEKGFYSKDEKGCYDPENLDINKLPENLKEKYCKKDEKDNKVKLSLYKSYELLLDLDEPIGNIFLKEFLNVNLKKLLSLRNKSILAHGFNTINENNYTEMLSLSENFIKNIYSKEKIDKLKENIKFLQINI